MHKHTKKGFTFIGILAIVLVIGVVAGVSFIIINSNKKETVEPVVNNNVKRNIDNIVNNPKNTNKGNVKDNILGENISIKTDTNIVDNVPKVDKKVVLPKFKSIVTKKQKPNNNLSSNKNTSQNNTTPSVPTVPNNPVVPEPPLPPVLVAGQRDKTFDTGISRGFNGQGVVSIETQINGKLLVGGLFDKYNGELANGIVRLNSDGSIDKSFSTGTGFRTVTVYEDGGVDIQVGSVYKIKLQPDEKILVGGVFNEYNGESANNIIRLNPDGTRDNSFDIGTGFSSSSFNALILDIELQTDGKILVGGYFSEYNSNLYNNIIRLNPDGSRDGTFDIGSGFDSFVTSIVEQSGGKILVGGVFNTYQGESANKIIRLSIDGTIDTSFNMGTGFDAVVEIISVQSDNTILVGGGFSQYNEVSAPKIVRLNPDGSRDNTFDMSAGFNSSVLTISIQNDDKILIGGTFNTYQGESANNIIRLNTDGSKDDTFNIGTGFNNSVYTITQQEDGKIIVGGSFIEYDGEIDDWYIVNPTSTSSVVAKKIIRLNPDASRDSSFTTGNGLEGGYSGLDSGAVITTAIQNDGKIIAGGFFTHYKGKELNAPLMRLNIDGSLDTSFNVGRFGSTAAAYITSVIIQKDGKIIVEGYFDSYQGESVNGILRLNVDGSIDRGFSVGSGFNNAYEFGNEPVYSKQIQLQSDGKIIVVGNFNRYREQIVNKIVRLNSDGTLDDSFNTDLEGINIVYEVELGSKNIVIQSDGKIIIGGIYKEGISGIVRLNTDGSRDNSFNIGTGFSSTSGITDGPFISSVNIQSNGKIIVGGVFDEYNGENVNGLLRLNIDGSRDTTFNMGTGFGGLVLAGQEFVVITKTLIQSDGKIVIGGFFDEYNGEVSNGIIRLNSNGSKDNSFNPAGTGLGLGIELSGDPIDASDMFNILTMTQQSDGKIIIGGLLSQYNGEIVSPLIRINN